LIEQTPPAATDTQLLWSIPVKSAAFDPENNALVNLTVVVGLLFVAVTTRLELLLT
jgi:hypothetical protein